ncbi:bifunctional methylenetetrahydrofolate dehydrogenase/methenyltetrahydrofolate cyclohydrolase FolD [Pseudoflavonifractor phocaeensis]|uniref:bifunctional methylenetetrahydrofolate dehydrogenase/methenyltetrahydrofolate cyclohydrolase FolD n=1 Tax=Pseudoflavonifractor phocaeensis TaxID=1870988 RepID=UPI001F33B463|nr:bifunctional methylenetetrahydrofolate dehydrogenase/methenyltetrahydrofolate cyclohydrolase FolD [Pseudoflavonifractor phocaeensis]MCF2660529.1 bifunctional methylenetetrahydrofolate dehydrogenase/methenyltetrahydrofolate cyclohydrolase FolD [Pseudoflavonifractor phocaeensis]
MSAVIMDGKALAAKIKDHVREQVEKMDRKPGLAVVLVGENPASKVYVNGKKKDCSQCGIYSEEYVLPGETTQEELLDLIGALNQREDIDGLLVQFPLPGHLDGKAVELAIRPDKDVDCVHPANMGYLMMGEETLWPCTPAGVMRLLSEYEIDPSGKRCVVVGRSNIVGKPQAMLMLWGDATVTVCHTKTPDLAAECRQADILVSAAGHTGLVTGDMIKPGAVVVDVAVNRNTEGKLCGDVVFEEALEKVSYITPVPGGVGPVTRAMLMENTLRAARRHGK